MIDGCVRKDVMEGCCAAVGGDGREREDGCRRDWICDGET